MKTSFGWGVSTWSNFRCDAGDPVFVLQNLVKCFKAAQDQWDGYLFKFGNCDIRMPPDFNFSEVRNHAPMLINTLVCRKDQDPHVNVQQLLVGHGVAWCVLNAQCFVNACAT